MCFFVLLYLKELAEWSEDWGFFCLRWVTFFCSQKWPKRALEKILVILAVFHILLWIRRLFHPALSWYFYIFRLITISDSKIFSYLYYCNRFVYIVNVLFFICSIRIIKPIILGNFWFHCISVLFLFIMVYLLDIDVDIFWKLGEYSKSFLYFFQYLYSQSLLNLGIFLLFDCLLMIVKIFQI